mgnify:CR=1 FL=1
MPQREWTRAEQDEILAAVAKFSHRSYKCLYCGGIQRPTVVARWPPWWRTVVCSSVASPWLRWCAASAETCAWWR